MSQDDCREASKLPPRGARCAEVAPDCASGLGMRASGAVSGDFCAKLRHYYEKQVGSPMAVTYLPPRLMGLISYQIEAIQWLTGGAIKGDGALLTPAMLQTARISYTFTSKRASEVLGYKPT